MLMTMSVMMVMMIMKMMVMMLIVVMMMMNNNEGRASRAQASRDIPCTGESGHPVHQRAKIPCTHEAVTNVSQSCQFLGLLGNLLLGTLAWEPVPGNLLGTCSLEPCLATNLAWQPRPGNPVPNLAPCGFGCSEGFSWKRKPFLGTWFPTLRRADFAAPTCSGAFTMAEDPKLTLLGKKVLKAAIPKN